MGALVWAALTVEWRPPVLTDRPCACACAGQPSITFTHNMASWPPAKAAMDERTRASLPAMLIAHNVHEVLPGAICAGIPGWLPSCHSIHGFLAAARHLCAGTAIPRGAAAQGKAIDPAKIVKTDDYARSHPRVQGSARVHRLQHGCPLSTRLRRGVYRSA
jgi:hypothetical protein